MMKLLLLVPLCLMLFISTFGQKEVEITDGFENMTFRVNLNKKNYYPLETAYVEFELLNSTNSSLSVTRPSFILESKLKVVHTDKISIYRIPTQYSGIPKRFPTLLKSGNSFSEVLAVDLINKDLFPKIGPYVIQFILYSPDKTKFLKSNEVSINIVQPIGLNNNAYKFLEKYSKYIGTFSWAFTEKEGDKILETFVQNYSNSIYGESAIYNLGMIFNSQGRLNEAENLFSRIKNSSNQVIAKSAKHFIKEIKIRKNKK